MSSINGGCGAGGWAGGLRQAPTPGMWLARGRARHRQRGGRGIFQAVVFQRALASSRISGSLFCLRLQHLLYHLSHTPHRNSTVRCAPDSCFRRLALGKVWLRGTAGGGAGGVGGLCRASAFRQRSGLGFACAGHLCCCNRSFSAVFIPPAVARPGQRHPGYTLFSNGGFFWGFSFSSLGFDPRP